jgi:hypothetical protein
MGESIFFGWSVTMNLFYGKKAFTTENTELTEDFQKLHSQGKCALLGKVERTYLGAMTLLPICLCHPERSLATPMLCHPERSRAFCGGVEGPAVLDKVWQPGFESTTADARQKSRAAFRSGDS